jgi:hypothetical protein
VERSAAESRERWDRRSQAQIAEVRSRYELARKMVIRCVFNRDRLAAASLLDPDHREFHDFTVAEEAIQVIQEAQVVLGLDPLLDFERLGIEREDRQVLDLSPPVKTVRLNRSGRTLKITPKLILSSTLGLSSPLGETAKLKGYLRKGDLGKLFRRLHSDLKNLWRLYEYGCLHYFVQIRWGFLRETRRVSWNLGQLPMLHEICTEARKSGRLIDIVLDSPPSWEEPWSRTIRAWVWKDRLRVLELDFCDGRGRQLVPVEDIYAARVSSSPIPRE